MRTSTRRQAYEAAGGRWQAAGGRQVRHEHQMYDTHLRKCSRAVQLRWMPSTGSSRALSPSRSSSQPVFWPKRGRKSAERGAGVVYQPQEVGSRPTAALATKTKILRVAPPTCKGVVRAAGNGQQHGAAAGAPALLPRATLLPRRRQHLLLPLAAARQLWEREERGSE